jgi:hypothetical protein
VSLLAAFAAFAVGFLMRPVGAVIFGHMGGRNHQRVVDDIPRFTSVSPVSFMTEVVGAFDA